MTEDALEFVNKMSKEYKTTILCGLKRVNGEIYGKIVDGDADLYWLPKYQLSAFHEKMIDKYLKLGGKIE